MVKLAVFRGPDPTAGRFSGGLLSGLEKGGVEGSVSMRFRGVVLGAVEAVWDARWQVFPTCRSWARGGRSRSAAS